MGSLRIKRKELLWGISLILVGILIPNALHVGNMGIYPDIWEALSSGQKIYIVIAALKLVLLNSIRGFPHYLGVFFIVEAFELEGVSRGFKGIKAILVCSVIPMVYMIIEKIYDIRYDFGIPAISMIALLVVVSENDFAMVSITKKATMVAFMMVSMQWLDVMPILSNYAFGRGETSSDIRMATIILDSVDLMQYTVTLFFCIFFMSTLLLSKLIRDENNLRVLNEEKKKSQKELMETQMRILESRTYMELQHLVHDLKSPLTSAQTLVGVIKLGNYDEKTTEYLTKIENSIERMSKMISEILYGNHTTNITTEEMIRSVMSQISGSEFVSYVHIGENPSGLILNINKIRFSRAIVNLLENAFCAINKEDGRIDIEVEEYDFMGGQYAKIMVFDNGYGIPSDKIDAVWKNGYSTKGSLGFGLNFVRKVIDDNSGAVEIESSVGVGTKVTIIMPIECLA